MSEASKVLAGLQVIALILGAAAVLFGGAAVYTVAHPGPSGEWTGVAVGLAYVVNLPAGLAVLAVGLFVKRGIQGLSGICIAVSVVVLVLPVLASLMWHYLR
jgi:hypothetical protein